MTDNYCSRCGSVLQADIRFCPQCGAPCGTTAHHTFGVMGGNQRNHNKTLVYIVLTLLFIALCLGGICLWKMIGANGESSSEAVSSESEYLTMETIIDLYGSKDKEYIRQVLKNNGYSLFTTVDDGEYWTKNVLLKAVMTDTWDKTIAYEPTERKGSSFIISGDDDLYVGVSVYSEADFQQWLKQIADMGYKEIDYGEDPLEKDGWILQGAHQNLCREFKDAHGNSIEFMKDGDGHPGYAVYYIGKSE